MSKRKIIATLSMDELKATAKEDSLNMMSQTEDFEKFRTLASEIIFRMQRGEHKNHVPPVDFGIVIQLINKMVKSNQPIRRALKISDSQHLWPKLLGGKNSHCRSILKITFQDMMEYIRNMNDPYRRLHEKNPVWKIHKRGEIFFIPTHEYGKKGAKTANAFLKEVLGIESDVDLKKQNYYIIDGDYVDWKKGFSQMYDKEYLKR